MASFEEDLPPLSRERLDSDRIGIIPPNNVGFPGYEIMELIAEGGMGVVFKAKDTTLNRIVALKSIRAGSQASEIEIQRFRFEAEAVAKLNHPNIVQVFEVGNSAGRHFFSMEYIEGGSVAQRLNELKENRRESVRLMALVARAVNHAHERGILHRDLKPGNILLDSEGNPHVTDFGLARLLTEDRDLTIPGTVLGTPNYMAPEQAKGEADNITMASDVFSLGAILYQLLTGQAPFRGATPLETLRQVTETEPPRPRTLCQRLDPDLETIVLKCLEKESGNRYASALDLAEELERWLRGEPIFARPASLSKRAIKWVKRRPTYAALIGISVIAVIALVAVMFSANIRLARERNAALSAQQWAEAQEYASMIKVAASRLETGKASGVAKMLDRAEPRLRGWEWGYLRAQLPRPRWSQPMHSEAITSMALNEKTGILATGGDDQMIRVWRHPDARHLWDFWFHQRIVDLALTPNAEKLLACSHIFVFCLDINTHQVLFYQTVTNLGAVCFDSSGKYCYAACDDGILYGYRTSDWSAVTKTPVPRGQAHRRLMLQAEGNQIIFGDYSFGVRFFRVNPDGTLAQERVIRSPIPRLQAMVYGSSSNILHLSSWRTSTFVDLSTTGGAKAVRFDVNDQQIDSIALSDDGSRLFLGTQDGIVKVFDVANHRLVQTHFVDESVRQVIPTSNGFLVGDRAGNVSLWDQEETKRRIIELQHSEIATGNGISFSPHGGMLAVKGWSRSPTVGVWSTRTWTNIDLRLAGLHERAIGFRPQSEELAVALTNEIRFLIRTNDAWRAVRSLPIGAPAAEIVFDRTGKLICAANMEAGFEIWDIASGKSVVPQSVRERFGKRLCSVTVKPDGSTAAVLDRYDPGVCIFPIESNGEGCFDLPARYRMGAEQAIVFHPKENILACTGPDDGIALWDLELRKPLRLLRGHLAPIACLEFSPDGKRLLSASTDQTVRLWDWRLGEELLVLRNRNYYALAARFSLDGLMLANTDSDNLGRVYLAAPWKVLNGDAVPTVKASSRPKTGRQSLDIFEKPPITESANYEQAKIRWKRFWDDVWWRTPKGFTNLSADARQ